MNKQLLFKPEHLVISFIYGLVLGISFSIDKIYNQFLWLFLWCAFGYLFLRYDLGEINLIKMFKGWKKK